MLFKGMLVELPNGSGVGKLDDVEDGICRVSVFRSVARSDTIEFPVEQLKQAYLSPQTRVYVRETEERFRVGRVSDFLTTDDGLVNYEVRFPNSQVGDYSEIQLFLRPWSAPDDPAEVLASGGAESQFLHDRRQIAITPLLNLRASAQGMTALVSSGIELAAHQVAAVRRILTDPVQRYLLADEVGLGKTIEAGLIIRQHLIDNPNIEVLVAVPSHLVTQWHGELMGKLRLDQFDSLVEVISHTDLASVRRSPDVLVVDEAHHLVGVQEGELSAASRSLEEIAPQSPVLLLLSATPSLGNERRFLALLNLLDPDAHPIDDLDGFRLKLEGRREIGRILLALDPDSPGLVLRKRAAELLDRFPDDPLVGDLAPQLIEATREATESVPELCSALKAHIADSYRIHQRLIRSRRADAQGWEFAPRGPQEDEATLSFPHVRIEEDASGWIEPVLPAIEEWRFSALEAAGADSEAIDKYAYRYAELLNSAGQGRTILIDWIDSALDADLYFQEENEILQSIRHLALSSEGDDGIETACESTRRLISSLRKESANPKIVVFSSSAYRARSFYSAFQSSVEDWETFLFAGVDAAEESIALEKFASSEEAAVLVCDHGGEEGLNLAFADAIVHLDLPFSAARIEQRIGRLDRFGRTHSIVRHRILLPNEEDDSPWYGWMKFLSNGLAIFNRSISDIQFLLDQFELQFFRLLLEQGPEATDPLATEIRDVVRDERHSQDEQYALDRIALAEEPVEDFIESIDDAEADEAYLEEAVDRWIIEALQLNKRPFSYPKEDPFKLYPTKRTLIPRLPWLEAFDVEEPRPLTWRRRIATNHPEVTLLRPGAPLIDLIERFTRWDDRGTAFVTLRTDPEWPGELWIGFQLCFVVEADLPIADLFSPTLEELAAIRRAQRYFQPQVFQMYVDSNGDKVTDPSLLSILQRPYRSSGRNIARPPDLNLASRPQLLEAVIDPSQFSSLCRSVRDETRNRLLGDPELSERITKACDLIKSEIQRRRLRIDRRREAGEKDSQAELKIIEQILPAVSKPNVRLEAMGCFVVSRERSWVHGDA